MQADTIEGGAGTDTIIIAAAGKGDSDTMDGGADADVLQLSAGAHAFADNDKLKNIETIKAHSSGSEVDLSAQEETLTIEGGAGTDTINAGAGDDIITIAAAGKGDSDTMDGGDGADVLQLSAWVRMPLRIMTSKEH